MEPSFVQRDSRFKTRCSARRQTSAHLTSGHVNLVASVFPCSKKKKNGNEKEKQIFFVVGVNYSIFGARLQRRLNVKRQRDVLTGRAKRLCLKLRGKKLRVPARMLFFTCGFCFSFFWRYLFLFFEFISTRQNVNIGHRGPGPGRKLFRRLPGRHGGHGEEQCSRYIILLFLYRLPRYSYIQTFVV